MTSTVDRPSSTHLEPWRDFAGDGWRDGIDVAGFIAANVAPHTGTADFLAGPTQRTTDLWNGLAPLFAAERERGILDVDPHTPSSITSHAPGFIDREHELIVGLQTDAPLKRAIMPNGGLRMVEVGLQAYGFQPDPIVHEVFTKYRKTHNDGVFDAYTPEILAARRANLITGLPDAYGRGRIIGDYRRVPLYGVARLIEERREVKATLDSRRSTADVVRDREELSEQIRSLGELVEMAATYGFDVTRPAETAQEAIQWLYLAYLAATKEQNGAAMSLGRTSTFLDIYLSRDIADGRLDETAAQELIDDFVIKLRIVRFLRTPAYDELFTGDPTWVTEAIGGIADDGRPLVTRTSYRYLQTLYNLGAAPEPNLTVLWSPDLPLPFKEFCTQVSIDTSSIQYESDELLRASYGDDAAIACCVSAMPVGKAMQFFGARVNLAKTLLYAINGGRDEISGVQVGPALSPETGDVLDYDSVVKRLDEMMGWLAQTYVDALNVIHYMHDKYAYERLEMALHDYPVHRTMACGIAGLSVAADSLSAIKYATVRPVPGRVRPGGRLRDRRRVPDVRQRRRPGRRDRDAGSYDTFMEKVRENATYRDAEPTQSVLTITSNVVYGKHTGNTPDGRRAGEPFAPGANPMNGRDHHGVTAAALSVAKLPYDEAQDGISLTTRSRPTGLGRTRRGAGGEPRRRPRQLRRRRRAST